MSELETRPQAPSVGAPIEVLRDSTWQMSYGERAGLEGILSQLKPALAVEIGTAEGGSLARIAAHSSEVHSFDLVEPQPKARELANVTFHIGDSHKLLPETLAAFAEQGRNVDFVLVDGDHSSDGVRRDMEDLLNSEATADTLIVMHDTMNPVVREGLEAVTFEAWLKVAYVELDLVAGQVFRQPSLFGELWGGLGLVVTGSSPRPDGATARQTRYFDTYRIVTNGREAVLGPAGREDDRAKPVAENDDAENDDTFNDLLEERDRALAELAQVRELHARQMEIWERTVNSVSWRVTRPLRAAKAKWAGSDIEGARAGAIRCDTPA